MPRDGSREPGFFGRSVPMKWLFIMVAALIVLMAVVVVVVVLVEHSDHAADRAAQTQDTSAAKVASPYDLVEMPADAKLDVVLKAAFVSIMLPNHGGTMTSYGVSSNLEAAQALMRAVAAADEAGTAATGSAGASGTPPTITFVLATRQTLTFTLSLDTGLITRNGRTWRPKVDLKSLVQDAIKSPQ